MYVMEVNIRPSFREKYATVPQKEAGSDVERKANAQRDIKIIKEMWCLVAMGLSIFLGGFAIWNLDNIYCSSIRRWRHQIGLPWGILLEGHGWCKFHTQMLINWLVVDIF
jgi:dihydroceramidase